MIEDCGKGLDLLAKLVFIVPQIRVDKGMVVLIDCSEMAAVQALARASCAFADETAVHILAPFRQCLCCETAAEEVYIKDQGSGLLGFRGIRLGL